MPHYKFQKVGDNAFIPADVETEQACRRLKFGDIVHGEFKKLRNPLFHRKFFALLKIGYQAWEPQELEGEIDGLPVTIVPQKSYEQFRADVTILAGYYSANYRLDNTVRIVPKSIAFANMDQVTFEHLYSKAVDVLLEKVLRNYTRDDLDEVVDKILGMI